MFSTKGAALLELELLNSTLASTMKEPLPPVKKSSFVPPESRGLPRFPCHIR